MPQAERPETAQKPEPFLTLRISEGDGGTYIRCIELNIGLGIGGADTKDETITAIQEAIPTKARILVRRFEEGTLPDDIPPEQLEFAKQVIKAIDQGSSVADLIKPEESSSVDISSGIDPNANTDQN